MQSHGHAHFQTLASQGLGLMISRIKTRAHPHTPSLSGQLRACGRVTLEHDIRAMHSPTRCVDARRAAAGAVWLSVLVSCTPTMFSAHAHAVAVTALPLAPTSTRASLKSTPTYPIPAVLPPHPRLYLNDDAMALLRKTVAEDSAAKAQYDSVVELGTATLTAELPDFATWANDCKGAIGLCRGPFGACPGVVTAPL
jgi:hypothetical protein